MNEENGDRKRHAVRSDSTGEEGIALKTKANDRASRSEERLQASLQALKDERTAIVVPEDLADRILQRMSNEYSRSRDEAGESRPLRAPNFNWTFRRAVPAFAAFAAFFVVVLSLPMFLSPQLPAQDAAVGKANEGATDLGSYFRQAIRNWGSLFDTGQPVEPNGNPTTGDSSDDPRNNPDPTAGGYESALWPFNDKAADAMALDSYGSLNPYAGSARLMENPEVLPVSGTPESLEPVDEFNALVRDTAAGTAWYALDNGRFVQWILYDDFSDSSLRERFLLALTSCQQVVGFRIMETADSDAFRQVLPGADQVPGFLAEPRGNATLIGILYGEDID